MWTFWKVGKSSFFAGAKFHALSLSQEAHVTTQPGDRGWERGGAWLCLGCGRWDYSFLLTGQCPEGSAETCPS